MEKKITVILESENIYYFRECKKYIEDMMLPRGWCLDISADGTVREDSPYIVYVKMGVFILDVDFMIKAIAAFESNHMISMIIGGENEDESSVTIRELSERDKLAVTKDMILKKEWIRIINRNVCSEEKYYLRHADLFMEFYDLVDEKNVVYQNYIYQILSMKNGREKAEYQSLLSDIKSGRLSLDVLSYIISGNFSNTERIMKELERLLTIPNLCTPNGRVDYQETLNIVTSINEKYEKYLCVMLQSVYENNRDIPVRVFVLHSELTNQSMNRIRQCMNHPINKIEFIEIDKSPFYNFRTTDMWSVEAYYRLQMLDLLPDDIDRALYLDVDVICNKNIYKLYFTDFEDYDIVGCCDIGSEIPFGDKRDVIFGEHINRSDFHYCNSGVMLWNVKKLRNMVSLQDYLSQAKQINFSMVAPDQDLINLVHAGRIGIIQDYIYDLFAWTAGRFLECPEVILNTTILHYVGSKPWDGLSYSFGLNLIWWSYARKMPFYEELLEKVIEESIPRDVSTEVIMNSFEIEKPEEILK